MNNRTIKYLNDKNHQDRKIYKKSPKKEIRTLKWKWKNHKIKIEHWYKRRKWTKKLNRVESKRYDKIRIEEKRKYIKIEKEKNNK